MTRDSIGMHQVPQGTFYSLDRRNYVFSSSYSSRNVALFMKMPMEG